MDANSHRRLTQLWEDQHTHDGEDFQEQITIIRSQIEQAGSVASQQLGAYIHLLAEGQEIADGGSAIEWASTHSLITPFEFNPTFPTAPVRIPKTGYYDIDVSLGWDTVTSGGMVWVVVHRENDLTIWPPAAAPGLWTADDGAHFEATAPGIPLRAGDEISVFAASSEGAADIAYASCVIHMEDRTELVPAPPEPPPTPGAQNLFVFINSGTFDWAAAGSPSTFADVWVIGGGGAGAKGALGNRAGGGGAGGVLHLEDYAVSGDVAVVVGNGGAAAVAPSNDSQIGGNGGDSSFDGQTAAGGGRGGVGTTTIDGEPGGSGGGGGAGGISDGNGGSGSQGGDGADGTTGSSAARRGGGGGGAGGNGTTGSSGVGGDGGPGIDLSAIVGTEYGDDGWFAGGGAGQARDANGTGGQGGGGASGGDGLANSGSGGGAGANRGGAGGKGIVIVKVADV